MQGTYPEAAAPMPTPIAGIADMAVAASEGEKRGCINCILASASCGSMSLITGEAAAKARKNVTRASFIIIFF